MKKPKKITVKFFLNRNLKHLDIDGLEHFPLYAQITYDRKNTQIKCQYGWFYKDLHQVQEQSPHLLPLEEGIFRRVVEYELKQQGEEFKLKGLGRKYEYYSLSIHQLINSYLKLRLKNFIHRAQPQKFLEVLNLEKPNLDFFTIYEASEKLFDNLTGILDKPFLEEMEIYRVYTKFYEKELAPNAFNFPVVIDWLDGSHRHHLEQKLNKHFAQQPGETEKCLKFIHGIISTKIGLV
ncbi:MAG: hypothetical protein OHK0053_18090 [Microscillaceae bacterium]